MCIRTTITLARVGAFTKGTGPGRITAITTRMVIGTGIITIMGTTTANASTTSTTSMTSTITKISASYEA